MYASVWRCESGCGFECELKVGARVDGVRREWSGRWVWEGWEGGGVEGG